jgi:glycosyltransferase involved in cell wall biosynthesis
MLAPLPVTLDIGPAVHQGAGLARYAERLTAALHTYCADRVDVSLFYNQHSGHTPPASLAALPTQTLTLGQYAWRLSVLASQISHIPYAPLRPVVAHAALYHATEHLLPRLTLPTVMTVHDLIFERYPQHHKVTNRLFLRVGMRLFVRAATQIVAVSQHTAHDLMTLYGVPQTKIVTIHEGVDNVFQPASPAQVAEVRARYSPDRPYLLMVGTLEPRKNHRLALLALAQLKAAGYPHRLLIVGGKGWLFTPISALVEGLELGDRVTFTGYAPAADLPALYSAADALLLPSLYEGFGFPLLEAMCCGAPVVCSRASSLPELAGDAALLIDPADVDGLVAAIQQILDRPALAADLRKRGFARARQFTWEATARRTADLYQDMTKSD